MLRSLLFHPAVLLIFSCQYVRAKRIDQENFGEKHDIDRPLCSKITGKCAPWQLQTCPAECAVLGKPAAKGFCESLDTSKSCNFLQHRKCAVECEEIDQRNARSICKRIEDLTQVARRHKTNRASGLAKIHTCTKLQKTTCPQECMVLDALSGGNTLCKTVKTIGKCQPFQRERCPRECHEVDPLPSVVDKQVTCTDLAGVSECFDWAAEGECEGKDMEWMYKNCMNACGLCEAMMQEPTPTPPAQGRHRSFILDDLNLHLQLPPSGSKKRRAKQDAVQASAKQEEEKEWWSKHRKQKEARDKKEASEAHRNRRWENEQEAEFVRKFVAPPPAPPPVAPPPQDSWNRPRGGSGEDSWAPRAEDSWAPRAGASWGSFAGSAGDDWGI